jgi:hypothetical protein
MRAKYPKASFHERTLDKLTQVLVILFLIRFTRQIIAFYDGYSLTPMKDIYIGSLVLLIWSGGSAQAARPFVTDDARLTTAGSCQLESWTRLNRASKPSARSEEFWAFPACNPSGNFEVTLGAALGRPLEGPQSNDYVVQAKTLFRTLSPGNWALGLAAGKVFHPEINPGPNQFGNSYFYLPWSYASEDERWVIHVNLGGLRDQASKNNRLTWGSGVEWKINERWLGISELFGDTSGGRYWQLGLRYSIIPDLLQVDSSLGRPFGAAAADLQSVSLPYGPARWVSFGLRFTPASIF